MRSCEQPIPCIAGATQRKQQTSSSSSAITIPALAHPMDPSGQLHIQSTSDDSMYDDNDDEHMSMNAAMEVDNDRKMAPDSDSSDSDCSSVTSDDRSTVTCVHNMISFYSKATDMLQTHILPDLQSKATAAATSDLVQLANAMQKMQSELEDVQYRLFITGNSSYSKSDVCSALCGCVKVSAYCATTITLLLN
jgi:hypothetical protein